LKRVMGWVAVPTLVITGALAPTASAEQASSISISVADGTSLLYGSPLNISATNTAGNPVRLQATGACFITNLAQQTTGLTQAIVMATSTRDTCTVTAVSGEGEVAQRQTVTLRTEPGPQRARFKREGGTLKPRSTQLLAPRDQRTMQGQPMTFRVQRGKGSCSVIRVKQNWLVRTTRPGVCVIQATARGLGDLYLPYAQPLSFRVR